MSDVWHVTHLNAYEGVMVHICYTYKTKNFLCIYIRHQNRNELCHTCEWVMSHIWMSHVTHIKESCHTYERVMSQIWKSHVTYMNESCHTYERLAFCIPHTDVLCIHTGAFKQTYPALMTSVDIQKDVDIRKDILKDARHQSLYIYT